MSVEPRSRPIKLFRVLAAYGPYVKGALIQPTGLYRDMLLRRGLIEEVKEAVVETDRMVRGPAQGELVASGLLTRGKGKNVR